MGRIAMELPERKGSTTTGTYKTLGNIFVPTGGTMVLGIVALQFLRHSGSLERAAMVSIAIGIAVVGLSYYNFSRALNQLDGKAGDNVLSRLCHAANAMAMFGFVTCLMALIFGPNH
jgi:hypothetical protein